MTWHTAVFVVIALLSFASAQNLRGSNLADTNLVKQAETYLKDAEKVWLFVHPFTLFVFNHVCALVFSGRRQKTASLHGKL